MNSKGNLKLLFFFFFLKLVDRLQSCECSREDWLWIICANDRFLAGHGCLHHNVTKQIHVHYLSQRVCQSQVRGHVDIKHATITWRDQTPVENAKCWLSPWHWEVGGPFARQSAHMSPFYYSNRGSLPHLPLSPSFFSPPLSQPLSSYLIQQSVEKEQCVWVTSSRPDWSRDRPFWPLNNNGSVFIDQANLLSLINVRHTL